MHKDDLAEALRRSMETMGDSIVNPRCDACNTPLPTPKAQDIGLPRLCNICTLISQRDYQARSKDWMGQERPRGRTTHVVKLPEGMRQPKDPVLEHILREADKDTDFTPI